MIKNIFMKNILLGLFVIVTFLASCDSKKKPSADEISGVLDSVKIEEPSISEDVISDIIQQIPSPLEISTLLKESETKYDKEYLNDPEKISDYNSNYKKAYVEANAERLAEKRKLDNKENTEDEDILFRLNCVIRGKIGYNLKSNGYSKCTNIYDILGCSFEELMKQLNNNPYNLTFGEIGLDIKYIIPASLATTEEELLKLNHHSNLQLNKNKIKTK
jgi:hypothetical protein